MHLGTSTVFVNDLFVKQLLCFVLVSSNNDSTSGAHANSVIISTIEVVNLLDRPGRQCVLC